MTVSDRFRDSCFKVNLLTLHQSNFIAFFAFAVEDPKAPIDDETFVREFPAHAMRKALLENNIVLLKMVLDFGGDPNTKFKTSLVYKRSSYGPRRKYSGFVPVIFTASLCCMEEFVLVLLDYGAKTFSVTPNGEYLYVSDFASSELSAPTLEALKTF